MVTARQFDVFENPKGRGPPLLIIQADLLAELDTRIVAPLVPLAAVSRSPATRLNPVLPVAGEKLVMLTQQLGAIRTAELKKRITNLAPHRDRIIGAVDVLLSGV